MSTRIRYVRENSILRSTKLFTDNEGRELQVLLNTSDYSYKILNINNNQTVIAGEGFTDQTSLLKKAAKDALVTLGVNFNNETRSRT